MSWASICLHLGPFLRIRYTKTIDQVNLQLDNMHRRSRTKI